jgi:hypothetical protein
MPGLNGLQAMPLCFEGHPSSTKENDMANLPMSTTGTPTAGSSAMRTPTPHVMRAMEDRSVTSRNPSGEKMSCAGCPYTGIGRSIEPCYWINPENSVGSSTEMIGDKHRSATHHDNSVEVT